MESAAQNHIRELGEAYNALQSRNEELHRQLQAARKVHTCLASGTRAFPLMEECEFAGLFNPATETQGVFQDVLRIGKNACALVSAQVQTKGVSAVLAAALLKLAFRSHGAWDRSPDQVCQLVFEEIGPVCQDLGLVVSAWYGTINLETSVLECCNAGHDPALLLRFGMPDPEYLGESSGPLGNPYEGGYRNYRCPLQEGDTLFLFSRGIPRTINLFNEVFGQDRLETFLQQNCLEPVDKLISSLESLLQDFAMGNRQTVDQAALAIRFHFPAAIPRRP